MMGDNRDNSQPTAACSTAASASCRPRTWSAAPRSSSSRRSAGRSCWKPGTGRRRSATAGCSHGDRLRLGRRGSTFARPEAARPQRSPTHRCSSALDPCQRPRGRRAARQRAAGIPRRPGARPGHRRLLLRRFPTSARASWRAAHTPWCSARRLAEIAERDRARRATSQLARLARRSRRRAAKPTILAEPARR